MQAYVLLEESEGWEPSAVVGVYLDAAEARCAGDAREPHATWQRYEASDGSVYWQSARHRIAPALLTNRPPFEVYGLFGEGVLFGIYSTLERAIEASPSLARTQHDEPTDWMPLQDNRWIWSKEHLSIERFRVDPPT